MELIPGTILNVIHIALGMSQVKSRYGKHCVGDEPSQGMVLRCLVLAEREREFDV